MYKHYLVEVEIKVIKKSLVEIIEAEVFVIEVSFEIRVSCSSSCSSVIRDIVRVELVSLKVMAII